MRRFISLCFAVGLTLGAFVVPQTASADKGRGNDHRAGNHQNCPPGLARRNPPCVPPGQARNGVTPGEQFGRYRIGDRLDRDDFYFDDEQYDLPRLTAGRRYAVVNGNLVVLNSETYEILELIRALRAITN